ncbi:MAG TPA: Uma2 family endonuclease [Actinoplanes sp.]|nr:Uma2 family endonuclease [Actinoplanes sp.]
MTAAVHLVAPELIERHDLTVDDVANLPDELHCELIDGRLVLTPAALPIHQNIGANILHALKLHAPRSHYVSLDQSVALGRNNERRPDVVALRVQGATRTPVRVSDVCLVVEIFSKSSRVIDNDTKMKAYAYAGIPTYWIVDPLGEWVTFTEFILGPGGDYRRGLHTDKRVTLERPWAVTLDPPAWTDERNWLEENSRPGE